MGAQVLAQPHGLEHGGADGAGGGGEAGLNRRREAEAFVQKILAGNGREDDPEQRGGAGEMCGKPTNIAGG
jgi:hypothetical protein